MCKMEITDLIKGMESANVSDIYIFLHEDGPVAFDASAAHLLCYFPEMEMESVFVVTANVTELYRDSHWNRCWNDWRNTRVWLMTIVSE